MNSVMVELLLRVANGETFYIDFEKRTLKVGKQYLIKKGEIADERELGINPRPLSQAIEELEYLYKLYKYSTPNKRDRWKYFKPLEAEEMTTRQMVLGKNRNCCRAALEGAMLCMIISNILYWDNETMKGTYFYKGEDGFRLYKDWIK